MIGVLTDVILGVAAVTIGVAAILGVDRMVKGPSSLDRVVAADLIVAIAIAGVAIWIVHTREAGLLVVLLVLGILGFTGAASVARLVGDRSAMVKRDHSDDGELP